MVIIDNRKLRVYVFVEIKSKDFRMGIMNVVVNATLFTVEPMAGFGVVPNR